MELSVIIPAYNESKNIPPLFEELARINREARELNLIGSLRILLVDDHSSDMTFDVAVALKEKYAMEMEINAIRLSHNAGSHTAIRCGFANSEDADCAVALSADGQDDPSCIIRMLQKWKAGSHVVWALRKNRKNELFRIRFPAALFRKFVSWANRIGEQDIDLTKADFFLLDKKVVAAINACSERVTSLFGLIAWAGFKQDYVEYERRTRKFGKSKWSFSSRLNLAKDWIVAFSGLPLKLMFLIGILVASWGFLYTIYILVSALGGNPVQGWASIMVAVLVLGGVQMIMLAIVGEYMWRDLEESRKRPTFFIERNTLDDSRETVSND
jgi:dolichol-phosphate mannosyltransferase